MAPSAASNLDLLDLIRRIASGDQAALGALYDATARQVFGVAKRILRDDSDAEEVTMAVYLEVWRRAKDYEVQRGLPMSWLLMMARSRAIDSFRARRKDQHVRIELAENDIGCAALEPSESLQGIEQLLLEAQQGDIVRKAIQTLSPDQRQVIELTFFGGLTNQEVADYLAVPLGTVKGRIRLALQHLRRRLEPAMRKGWL